MSNNSSAENTPKIYAAIAGVISDVGAVGKDKINKQQGFKFRSIDDVYNALHPALAKNKVFIVPKILDQQRHEVGKTKTGATMTLVICKIKFTFYAEDGSSIETIVIGEGLDTGDKGTNKAMAIAYKYACFQVFCIPTEEMIDPDSENVELEESKTKSGNRSTAIKEESRKNASEQDKEKEGAVEDTRITEAMINTIKAEQMRTGVTDKQVLSRKFVTAKSIPEMSVKEFKQIMSVFQKTPDLKAEEGLDSE